MVKNILFFTLFSIFFIGCATQQDPTINVKNKKEEIHYLLETKDINNLKTIEVSNDLIQILPVINITNVEILYNKQLKTTKNLLFRNENCLFLGEATIDDTLKRINVELKKATCKIDNKYKVTYKINGWVAAEDDTIGLKAKWTIVKKGENSSELIISLDKGEYSYLVIDSAKQLESLVIKDKPEAKKSSTSPITQHVIKNNTTKLIKLK